MFLIILSHNNYTWNTFKGKSLGNEGKENPQRKMTDDVIQIMGYQNCQEMKQTEREKNIWLQQQGTAFR